MGQQVPDLAGAIGIVLGAERGEDPRPHMADGELVDLVRSQLGIGNTGEINYWLANDVVTAEQADAYKAVLCATAEEIDAAR